MSLIPASPARWVAAGLGVWSLLATAAADQPRYTRVVGIALGLVVLAIGVVPAEYSPRARAVVLGMMTVFLALAGVVAALSIDEAMTLVDGAIVAGLAAPLFRATAHRARHAAPST